MFTLCKYLAQRWTDDLNGGKKYVCINIILLYFINFEKFKHAFHSCDPCNCALGVLAQEGIYLNLIP